MWIALIVGYCLSKSCCTFTTVPGHSVLNFSRYLIVENMSSLEGNNVAHLFWQSLLEYGRELCTVQFRSSKVLSSCAISSKRIGLTWLLRLINTCTFSGLQTWSCFLRMLNTSLNWVDAFPSSPAPLQTFRSSRRYWEYNVKFAVLFSPKMRNNGGTDERGRVTCVIHSTLTRSCRWRTGFVKPRLNVESKPE